MIRVVAVFAFALLAACARAKPEPQASPQVTFESLLTELTDRSALARLPLPVYTAVQFSSYDRASTSKDAPEAWFANNDQGHYLRTEQTQGRLEYVLAEAEGPGAIVRIWSPNPKGTLRVYLDNDPTPRIEARMEDLLAGKAALARVRIPEPIAMARSRGWNLYFPIPFATACKITTDEGPLYYHVNLRRYAPGTRVESVNAKTLAAHADTLAMARDALLGKADRPLVPGEPTTIAPGETQTLVFTGPQAVDTLAVLLAADDTTQALRSTVLLAEFDGQRTVWCPLGEFFGSGVGLNPFRDHFREVTKEGLLVSRFVMPFAKSATLTFKNLADKPVRLAAAASLAPWRFDDRSMHFHTVWRTAAPFPVKQAAGTLDWNYADITGAGVYVADSLTIVNPVLDWWGEGDEKIYVDAEPFPSHFGTGTEDYYGFGWCDSNPFNTPFVSQTRCDGMGRSNRGFACMTRVRALDAIPFTKSLSMNIEAWHWIACDITYATTASFYARPGAATNITPDEAAAKAPVPSLPPLPPPFTIPGAIECESLTIAEKSAAMKAVPQALDRFGLGKWSHETHLWCLGTAEGEYVELLIPAPPGRHRVTLHATKSWDYATVAFALNTAAPADPVDLYSGGEMIVGPSGPIDMGVAESVNGVIRLRATITGKNPAATRPGTYFGLDAVVLTPEK
jgi:hypothetical protein